MLYTTPSPNTKDIMRHDTTSHEVIIYLANELDDALRDKAAVVSDYRRAGQQLDQQHKEAIDRIAATADRTADELRAERDALLQNLNETELDRLELVAKVAWWEQRFPVVAAVHATEPQADATLRAERIYSDQPEGLPKGGPSQPHMMADPSTGESWVRQDLHTALAASRDQSDARAQRLQARVHELEAELTARHQRYSTELNELAAARDSAADLADNLGADLAARNAQMAALDAELSTMAQRLDAVTATLAETRIYASPASGDDDKVLRQDDILVGADVVSRYLVGTWTVDNTYTDGTVHLARDPEVTEGGTLGARVKVIVRPATAKLEGARF